MNYSSSLNASGLKFKTFDTNIIDYELFNNDKEKINPHKYHLTL